jgi:predicted NBD/HSP70 family sugar kinase
MLFSTAGYYKKRRYRQKDIEKAMIYEAIADTPGTTRKQLHKSLKLRPNNVTDYVQELVEEQLVIEHDPKITKKGRPEIPLSIFEDKHLSIAVWVVSSELIGAFVNSNGQISKMKSIVLDSNTDNEVFKQAVKNIIEEKLMQISKYQYLIGIGFSLPGIINRKEKIWHFNSRWPSVKDFGFSSLEELFNTPIALEQIIDAELTALISKTKKINTKNNLLIHWGYGIGASFSNKGDIVYSTAGSFSELGHLKMVANDGEYCTCGDRGCLETVSSIRALLPHLRKKYGILPENENELAEKLQDFTFQEDPIINYAIDTMAEAVNIAYRILFPDLIFIYGPLLLNSSIQKKLFELLVSKLPSYSKDKVSIEFIDFNISLMNAQGCTMGFFKKKFREILRARH